MTQQLSMQQIAQKMIEKGKGILAIDESCATIKKRFDSIKLESTEKTRQQYRELLITASGIESHISGMILFDETIRQATQDGQSFPKALAARGILTGIKVDQGAKDLALHPEERITEGLDGLQVRLIEYKALGASFAKWRAVIQIGDHMPSLCCIQSNIHALARYSAICQAVGIVPMVEPEVLMDGSHSIHDCYTTTKKVLHALFTELAQHRVALESTILKVNMVVPGKSCSQQNDPDDVAHQTVKCLLESVPAMIPGIVFLSGGQSPESASLHLSRMIALYPALPWTLSFSYGRALQEPCLQAWKGKHTNLKQAEQALLYRAKCNSMATLGEYYAEV